MSPGILIASCPLVIILATVSSAVGHDVTDSEVTQAIQPVRDGPSPGETGIHAPDPADSAVPQTTSSAIESAGETRGPTVTIGRDNIQEPFQKNFRWSELDQFPTDIASHRGIFIVSADGRKMLRLYGSLRTRANWTDRDISSPWAMDYSLLPSGAESRANQQYEFTARGSRFGFDVSVRDLLSIRMEFDFRGTNDELRRRQMYLRTQHWVIGKNWTSFNTANYLLLSLDYHSTGAHAGVRTPQIKYLNGFDATGGTWKYSISLEDNKPDIVAPEELEASGDNVIPNLAGHIAYGGDWGEVRVAGLVAPNRVRSTGGTRDDVGWGLQTGMRWKINDSNIIKAHVISVSGQNSLMADFAPGDFDMVYDPVNDDFENLLLAGASLGLEHYWTPGLSTSIGGSYVDFDLPDFLDDRFFDHGHKALINLIWRPQELWDGLTTGVEWVYASRTDKDAQSSQSNRIILACWYDF